MSGENNDTLALFQETVVRDTSLVNVSDKRITSLRPYIFYGCYGLTSVDLPSVTSVGKYSFYYDTALENIFFPSVETINAYAFWRCTSIETIELQSITSIATYAFAYCTALERLVLPGDTVAVLDSWSALIYTPINTEDDIGYIYVNPDLVDDYKSATNWSTFADKIFAIGSVVSNSSDARTSVEAYEFQDDADIYYFDFPACETVGEYAFDGCTSLVGFGLGEQSNAIEIGDYAFYQCTSLYFGDYEEYNTIHLGDLTYIGDYAFAYAGCDYDGEVSVEVDSVDNLESIGTDAFIGANSYMAYNILFAFNSVSGGALSWIGYAAFIGMTIPSDLTFDVCPDATSTTTGLVFNGASFCNTAAGGDADGYTLTITCPCVFNASEFYQSDLMDLYLTSEVCVSTLVSGAFDNTLIDTGYGSVHVPESLYDDYCNDTNWCAYPIEVI